MSQLMDRRLDPTVLLHNAGTVSRTLEHNSDGLERTMAVNYFTPFLFTHLLLRSPSGHELTRIVNVTTRAHDRGQLLLEDLNYHAKPERFGTIPAYFSSKLAQVLFTIELARRCAGRRIAVNAVHPGVVSTKLLKAGFNTEGKLHHGAS
jgi:NAD(P)-dependent dehydrogenase (short-subunit alcohol dehydrogenase family)